MDTITRTIAKQSKGILVLVKITSILLFVLIGITAFILLSTWVTAELPILRLGNTDVFAAIPLQTLLGVEFDVENASRMTSLRVDLCLQLLRFIFSLVMLYKIRSLFTRIRESKDPFTADVVKPMKTFAILLGLIIGIQNMILGVVVALVIYTFALIFQYGGELQTQVDETL